MNEQELKYFSALSKDRAESADMLEKPSMRGIKRSVVEKYSDQAHFIYELLQNADDALATHARFILEPSRLIFAHNGRRNFSVSNPADEDHDSEVGRLGDVNAITSIANSNKTEASIGKFGVGFKAVFQYTTTPHIYDPDIRFKIERFIVPILLKEDFTGRQPDETLFVFPFDHPKRNPAESYRDIADKLQNLTYPLLFLSRLKSIEFRIGDTFGCYGKEIVQSQIIGDITAEKIHLTHKHGEISSEDYLWLFTRKDEDDYKYSVGFFLDREGRLRPIHEPAFCFFPTKEVTNLNFVIHAPFLLTDSREGIRAGVYHNDYMIDVLARLAANSLVLLRDLGKSTTPRLIDDSIISIIPTDPNLFSDLNDRRKISFLPFYRRIKSTFENISILPSSDGYVNKDNAYWAASSQLPQLFSDKQLARITENEHAHWVFTSLGRDDIQRTNRTLFSYIDSLVRTNISEDVLLSGRSRVSYYNRELGRMQAIEYVRGMTPTFIEEQDISWLHNFYKWLSDSKHRAEVAKTLPVFLDRERKAVAAFDKENHLSLFLPVEGMNNTGYSIVHPKLIENPETKDFLITLGVKQPSLKDQIYNIILPMYKREDPADTDSHFELFFKYFCKCPNDEVERFINQIKKCKFLKYYCVGDAKVYHGAANTMYFPTLDNKRFLAVKKDSRFVSYSAYKEIVGEAKEKQLDTFLTKLGVRKDIIVTEHSIDRETSNRKDLPHPYTTREISWKESTIDGCRENIEYISKYQDKERSVLLWDSLLRIIGKSGQLQDLLTGKCEYFYYYQQVVPFSSSDTLLLRDSAWLYNSNGDFVKPQDISKDTLSQEYRTDSNSAASLMAFLDIPEHLESEGKESEEDSNLTDSQREKIAFAEKIRSYGIESEDDLEEFKRFCERKKTRSLTKEKKLGSEEKSQKQKGTDLKSVEENELDEIAEESSDELEDNIKDKNKSASEVPKSSESKGKIRTTAGKVVTDIVHRTKNKRSSSSNKTADVATRYNTEDDDVDQDEFMPPVIDYSKRIEQAKQKSVDEIDKIIHYQELQENAINAQKYSFSWFKTLLEMESLNSNEMNSQSKQISISFAKVEREPGTKRTLILKHPSRYIPQFMEDLSDIPLVLHMGETTQSVAIEVANIKSYTLRVKIKNSEALEGIDLTKVTSANIDAKSPSFLLDALRREFSELKFDDDYDLLQNLCDNIEFIFGPPGTGKTTYLAKQVLLPLMNTTISCKVLVLTPTNKSADVIVRRLMEVCATDLSYEKWLIRFGATGDEEIERSPVFKDKTFDIRTLDKSVTVTTIARFPYDYFMPKGDRLYLNAINWDYIVIDEASMIPLANIIYPLYKKTPQKFIIAGDPFQIEPITTVDLWKNENIYTLVNLNSFASHTTRPHQYHVELLTTQYRSIPEIGRIFSDFAYNGILKHFRAQSSQKALNLDQELGIRTLNILKFPVSKYESIYRAKRLQHSSSYQIYSALFVYEYVSYLARKIAERNQGDLYKIGVIAPYRAQADMIDKLFSSAQIPKEVEVQVGTIHGFQGDECNIIFAVFNTPPKISSSGEMFLNKLNIINVSISRARDYLFIVMPDDNTEGIENLRLVRRVEGIIKRSDDWSERNTTELEELMFDDAHYLENNAFSTSHQSVNVYGLPEKCYEVRTEDNAVDIQIHNPKRTVDKHSVSSHAEEVKPIVGEAIEGDVPEEIQEKQRPRFDERDHSEEESNEVEPDNQPFQDSHDSSSQAEPYSSNIGRRMNTSRQREKLAGLFRRKRPGKVR